MIFIMFFSKNFIKIRLHNISFLDYLLCTNVNFFNRVINIFKGELLNRRLNLSFGVLITRLITLTIIWLC